MMDITSPLLSSTIRTITRAYIIHVSNQGSQNITVMKVAENAEEDW